MTATAPETPEQYAEAIGPWATATEAYDLITVDVPAEHWIEALTAARDALGLAYFDWLSAVDELAEGFSVAAHLARVGEGRGPGSVHRLLLRTRVPRDAAALPTAIEVYAGAAWHERETHEMFGIDFTGHPHLVHLLLPEQFEGHPLRKEFVLAARVAKAWPGAKEPGESDADHGHGTRRKMQPPGVPDPNDWGPLKGTLPPAPERPARGRAAGARAAAAGDRPARRARSVASGSVSQAAPDATPSPEGTAPAAGGPAETPAPRGPRRARSVSEGSASRSAPDTASPETTPPAPAAPEGAAPAASTAGPAKPSESAPPTGEASGEAARAGQPSADEASDAPPRADAPEQRGPQAEPPDRPARPARSARAADLPWNEVPPAAPAPEAKPGPEAAKPDGSDAKPEPEPDAKHDDEAPGGDDA